ncbi:hypothetical protein HS088_TW11G00398 [Tripterygium wilfordii]|uniref:Uncharacterized protein n=1 Tax=Tripterygium wilfordii TaxID=458696 RepID=A0A7J7D1X3_TRIWF|nr:uncharacterized protein LOC120009103 [Tripterygium wilfordii]KAF5740331.1 hypothetical protein HS088_TW11G00398 [Tripterygium wilfordii]
MEALKKAYAEIILNTAKEAAARVMLSERRALRFEQELRSAKDEGLRLLVRMKQMIDSKTNEAELTSLCQQRKIDELEAQLQEAEGIVTDLRAELYWMRDKLEKLRDDQVLPMNGQLTNKDTTSQRNPGTKPMLSSSSESGFQTMKTSDMDVETLNPSILDSNCSNRNGFTQRIHAFDGNSLDGRGPCSGTKNEVIVKASDIYEGKCTVSFVVSENMETMEHFSQKVRKLHRALKLKRRKARFGNAKATSCKSRRNQLLKCCQASSIFSQCKTTNWNVKPNEVACTVSSFKTESMTVSNTSNSLQENLQKQSNCSTDELRISHERKKKRKVQNKDSIYTSICSQPNHLLQSSQPPSALTHCKAFLLKDDVNSGKDQPKIDENGAKMKSLPLLNPGLTVIKSDVDPTSGSRNITVSIKALDKSGSVQNTMKKDLDGKNGSLVKGGESLFSKQKGDAAVKSGVPCSVSATDLVSVQLVNSDLQDAKAFKQMNGSHSQAGNGEVLQYTRKRKKEPASSP